MKDPPNDGAPAPSAATIAADSPVGQHLIKAISNVCLSLFVLSVLVFTVIAVTYHPPDPWFESSHALTASLSAVLPNSTFHSDDSLLPTGEDLVPLAPSSSPPLPSPTALNSSSSPPLPSPTALNSSSSSSPPLPSPTALNSSSSAPICDPDAPINCSDPRALAAILRFNARVFRRSIIFLSYSTPVPGPSPGVCDAAWRFRNRREKSWRRYRDYRRFRLAPADNCTYAVLSAGKFRSGTNAATARRSPRIHTPSSPQIQDTEINDTIPTLGSDSQFRRGKYLYYSRGGDYCKGMNHYLWSFLCGLAEAKFLNRTFVMDLTVCLAATYNPTGRDEEGKDFRYYFDFEHLKESASIVEEGEFLRDWRRSDRSAKKNGRVGVHKVPTYKVSPMQLKRDRSGIIWRQFDGPEPENYWYRVCEGRAAKHLQRPWQAIWKSKHLMNIVTQIAGKMDWDYDAVHVVRGEKAKNTDLWPNLDRDTSPDTLVEKVTKLIPPWRNLYIATNEQFYNYFDKLRSHYKVHLLDDYKEMWGNKSEWYNETMVLNGGHPVEFDGYMRVAVDTEVLYRAKTRVETFNNLTMDCKDGINTC